MATFSIFYGAAKPMRAAGVNQCRLLRFAEKYRGWHSYSKDRSTVRAIMALEARGYLNCNHANKQFAFTYPKG